MFFGHKIRNVKNSKFKAYLPNYDAITRIRISNFASLAGNGYVYQLPDY
jgi:hypothetical protein